MRRREMSSTGLVLLAFLTAIVLWLMVSGLYMLAFLHSWWVYR